MPPLKKRKLLSVSRFLDISAAERDDEESDGFTEEEDQGEGHLDDGASDEDIEDGDAARDTPKRVSTEDLHSPSAEELAQDVISRYRASNTLDSHTGLSDAMHLFLQPTDEDPPLWVCKVKAGYETDIVLSIFERHGGPNLFSAFALPSRSGLVYLEASSFSEAFNCLFRGSDMRPLYSGVIDNEVPHIVPLDERLASLISLPPSHSISALSFIRVNEPRSIYNGDIGFAMRNDHAGWIQIALVPRITPHETGTLPNPALFDVNHYPDESFEFLDNGIIAWDSRDLFFYHGYMVTEYRDTSLSNLFVHDPLSDLMRPTADFDDRLLVDFHDAGFCSVGTDVLDLVLAVRRHRSQSFVHVGSRVHMFAGEYAGHVGTVVDIHKLYAVLTMLCDGVDISVDVPLACIALEFKVGDYVEIIAGLHKGHTGLVIEQIGGGVSLGNAQLVVIEKITYNQVVISMYDAVSCPPDSDFNFSKHARMLCQQHLVRGARVHVLDGSHRNLVGQIIDISQSVATLWFSDQDRFSSLAIDSLALHFEQGDVVKIICGQHKDRRGRVRSIVDNPTSQSRDEDNIVISLTHTSELVTVPRFYVAFELGGHANQLDPMIHKSVEIINGPNKGYRGEVRAVGHGVFIVVVEASHEWKTVPMEHARELIDVPRLPSPPRPSTPVTEGTADMNQFELATTWAGSTLPSAVNSEEHWLLHARVQAAMQEHRLQLYFHDIAGTHGARGSRYVVETILLDGPRHFGLHYLDVKIPGGTQFHAPIGQVTHIDGYSGNLVIVMSGKHIGFVGRSQFLRWRDKTNPRMTIVTASDSSSVTVGISRCARVIS